ncbi:PRR7 isoform 1, partial [Pongo abelii]
MVMSQGTYTFLTCFAGFWLIWGLIVLLCCFCSFLRRRLKRRQEERLREQNLRALELEPLELEGSLAGSPPGLAPPQPPPHRSRLEAPAHAHSHPHVHVHPLLHHGPAQPHAHAHPHPHHHALPHPPPPHLSVPPRPWSYPRQAESDMSKPPCYEEAVLMAEPPPPYSEVLTDTRGLYR